MHLAGQMLSEARTPLAYIIITLGTCILSQDLYYKTSSPFLNTKKQHLRFHYSKTLNKAASELELVFGTDQSISVDLASLEDRQ